MTKGYKKYQEVLEQVKYPHGVLSKRIVYCKGNAQECIGKLFEDNPSWRYKEMNLIS